jgi:hypothetical protein
MIDFAHVHLDALQMQTLMQTDSATPVVYNGRSMLLGDALAARLRGEGIVYEPASAQATGQPTRGSLRIDPARLSAEQRSELERTGNIAGFTSTDRNRATISVRDSSGSYQANISHDDAGNTVVNRGPRDLRDFYPDEVAEADPRFAHLTRRPQPDSK